MGYIPCAHKEDEATGARIFKREDNVVVVTFEDGSMYTQHSDGTKIHTNAEKTEIIVENDSNP